MSAERYAGCTRTLKVSRGAGWTAQAAGTSRNVTKIFSVVTTSRECGVVSSVDHDVIELHADDQGFLIAQLNGQPIGYALATSILNHAGSTRLVHETRPAPVVTPEMSVPVIGKAVACELHRELGRLGNRQHYALAGDVLNRAVPSLAAITAAERDLLREYTYGQLGLMVGGWAA